MTSVPSATLCLTASSVALRLTSLLLAARLRTAGEEAGAAEGAADARFEDAAAGACPCASCVDENTGAPLLDPKTVADDILLQDAELVGRYGLASTWSDGHRTGIFAWPMLEQLGELWSGS